MEITNGYNTLVHIGLCFGIGLMEHSLVALPCGSRLVRIDTRDDDDLILNLFFYLAKS